MHTIGRGHNLGHDQSEKGEYDRRRRRITLSRCRERGKRKTGEGGRGRRGGAERDGKGRESRGGGEGEEWRRRGRGGTGDAMTLE